MVTARDDENTEEEGLKSAGRVRLAQMKSVTL